MDPISHDCRVPQLPAMDPFGPEAVRLREGLDAAGAEHVCSDNPCPVWRTRPVSVRADDLAMLLCADVVRDEGTDAAWDRLEEALHGSPDAPAQRAVGADG